MNQAQCMRTQQDGSDRKFRKETLLSYAWRGRSRKTASDEDGATLQLFKDKRHSDIYPTIKGVGIKVCEFGLTLQT